ncbi:MAG: protein kinase [Phycisphaerae bacterium]|nr:protein kinase [Phycisphaerae bacterium]
MAAENFKEAGEIFQDAIEIEDPAKRARYLEDACKQDSELRAEVEALLRSHEKAGDFLEVPAVDSNVTLDGPQIEGPGTKIGRYELLELIGEGGMGSVYLAEQKEPVKRKVALKIVKLGMSTKEVVARFEAERQTLALLEHPNIAHVFDAGATDAGRPYFVMEYVEGKSITKYCDEQKLNIEQRLGLFKQICEGVHHAHQKGIIHRDIKPSNILVSVHGHKAVPKIIDFGIAKAITQPLTENASFTEHGQLLGTPEYMSPEQAEMAYQDLDTRSDIYSLGVLLYELLAGVTPFDAKRLREGGIDHIQQVICEEEPRTPSARLTSLGDKATAVAESRRTQIVTLTRRLHRELEWITIKAMRKDRVRRYRSASELADDIQNYLTGTPLIAGPESTVYRARKFVRKHAGSVATAALLLVVIVLGLVASILMGCRAEQARQQEASARKQVEQALIRAEKAERIAQERAESYRRAVYSNTLALTKDAIDKASFSRAQKLLSSCELDLRGWEWQHLNYMSPDPCIKTFRSHRPYGMAIAVSPDGRCIASASGGTVGSGSVKVLDTATGSVVMTLQHNDLVYTVAYSPDGKRIASAGVERTIKIWDVASGDEVMTLRGHENWIWWIAFSPDGRRIVSSSNDKTIKVWDANNGTEMMTLRGHHELVWSVVFSPDGKRIASGNWNKTIKVWDVASGNELITLRGHAKAVSNVVFSPDGERIFSTGYWGAIKEWDPAIKPDVLRVDAWIDQVAFSPDGKRIAASPANRNGVIKLWDAVSGADIMTLRGHQGRASIAFSPDGRQIVSGGNDKTVNVWNALRGVLEMTLTGHTAPVLSVAFSPDGKRIVSGSGDETVKVWNATTGVIEMTLAGHKHDVHSVTFSSDGTSICVGGDDGGITLWESVEPAAGYEPRQIANSARDLVDELYKKHDFYYDVISKLEDDNTINDSVRRVALQIANANLWKDARKLFSQSWQVVKSPDHNDVAYREAIEKLEKAISLAPQGFYIAWLGYAQYRLGAYEETLATLARFYKNIKDDAGIEPHPVVEGFRAMALHQLGRDEEANAVIEQVRHSLKEEWFNGRQATLHLTTVIEAEKLFAGEDSTLLSIWELIEEDKLEEASELAEKAHLSKNADYASRVEGAIKLLEVLRNLK